MAPDDKFGILFHVWIAVHLKRSEHPNIQTPPSYAIIKLTHLQKVIVMFSYGELIVCHDISQS